MWWWWFINDWALLDAWSCHEHFSWIISLHPYHSPWCFLYPDFMYMGSEVPGILVICPRIELECEVWSINCKASWCPKSLVKSVIITLLFTCSRLSTEEWTDRWEPLSLPSRAHSSVQETHKSAGTVYVLSEWGYNALEGNIIYLCLPIPLLLWAG